MTSKKVTIYDIADTLGISVGTVYRALHNTGRINAVTKEKVLQKAAELGFTPNRSAQGIRRAPITIGVLLCCPITHFLDEIQAGIEYEFSSIAEYNFFYSLHVLPPLNAEDCSELICDHLKTFREKRYNGVILFLSGSAEKCAQELEELERSNIPMVCIVNDLPYRNRVAFVSADGYCSGRMAAQFLTLCSKKGPLAILTGDRSIYIHNENVSGFLSEIENTSFKTVDIYEHKDSPSIVASQLNQIFRHEPHYTGLYITSAASIIACPMLMTLNKKKNLKVVSTDLFYQTKEAINQGVINSAIFQNPFLQGRKSVSCIYKYLQNNLESGNVKITPQMVMRSNIDLYHISLSDNLQNNESSESE